MRQSHCGTDSPLCTDGKKSSNDDKAVLRTVRWQEEDGKVCTLRLVFFCLISAVCQCPPDAEVWGNLHVFASVREGLITKKD